MCHITADRPGAAIPGGAAPVGVAGRHTPAVQAGIAGDPAGADTAGPQDIGVHRARRGAGVENLRTARAEAMDLILHCGPLSRFTGCPELARQIRDFLRSWPLALEPAGDCHVPPIHIRRDGAGYYIIDAPWLPEALREPQPAGFLCSFVIEAAVAVRRMWPLAAQMHAAAARLPAGVCLFLGGNRAGKSTLMARLMADGHVCLGDDIIGVTPQAELFSFGIPPRLRLPLPPSAALECFARAHGGLGDHYYLFLELASESLAPFASVCKPDSCIVLNRKDAGSAALRQLPFRPQELLRHFVLESGSAGAVLNLVQQFSMSFYELEYASLDDACELLEHLSVELVPSSTIRPGTCQNKRGFSGNLWPSPPLSLPGAFINFQLMDDINSEKLPAEMSPKVKQACPTARAGLKKRTLSRRLWRQSRGVAMQTISNTCYLISGNDDAIFSLNPLGAAIWQMLELPLSEAEAAELLAEIFPQEQPAAIASDVRRLFCELRRSGLICPLEIVQKQAPA